MASTSLEIIALLSSFSLFVLPKRGDSGHPGLPLHGAVTRAPHYWFPHPVMSCRALGCGRKSPALELRCPSIPFVWNIAPWELQWESWMTDRLTCGEGGLEKWKSPEKGQFYPFLPLDLWMMDLTSAIPRLLYSLRNKLLFQSRSCCSELKRGTRRGKCLTLLWYWVIWGSLGQLGGLWCSCIGGAIISSWEPNTTACLLGCRCAHGFCAFSSLAQPRRNFTARSPERFVAGWKAAVCFPLSYKGLLWYLLS